MAVYGVSSVMFMTCKIRKSKLGYGKRDLTCQTGDNRFVFVENLNHVLKIPNNSLLVSCTRAYGNMREHDHALLIGNQAK